VILAQSARVSAGNPLASRSIAYFSAMELENAHIMHAEEDADFDQIFRIREAVFEQEMGIAEEAQLDGFDAVAHHYIMVVSGRAVGVARWRVTLGGNIRLERLAILPAFRKMGLGAALMQKMLGDVPKSRRTFIECPIHQQAYFNRFGFQPEGEVFDFQGIPHVRMELLRAV
jgi:predicted GNAT family N-acyltransferase